MERHPVVSSNVRSVGYDPATRTLEVEFRAGSIYQYADVPLDVYDRLLDAESVGSFIARYIVGRYQYPSKEVPAETPAEGVSRVTDVTGGYLLPFALSDEQIVALRAKWAEFNVGFERSAGYIHVTIEPRSPFDAIRNALRDVFRMDQANTY